MPGTIWDEEVWNTSPPQADEQSVPSPESSPSSPSSVWDDSKWQSPDAETDTSQPVPAPAATSIWDSSKWQPPAQASASVAQQPAQEPSVYDTIRANDAAAKAQGVDPNSLNQQLSAQMDVANRPDTVFTAIEKSYPVRVATGAVQGVKESVTGAIATGLAQVNPKFQDAAEYIYNEGRSRQAVDSYLNAGSTLKNAIQGGVDILAQAAPAASMGLPGLAAYFGGTTAARTLTEAEQKGASTSDAYAQAATHGTIDAAWTLLGGKFLGTTIGKLAGAEGEGILSKVAGKLTEKLKLPSWSKVVGTAAEGATGQVAQGVGMGASHYLGGFATGEHEFNRDDFYNAMESTVLPSLVAGVGGEAIHAIPKVREFIGGIADTIEKRTKELPKAAEQAAKEPEAAKPDDFQWSAAESELKSKLQTMQPSGDPVNDGFAVGQLVSDVAKKHGVDIQQLHDRVIAPRGAEVTPLPETQNGNEPTTGLDPSSGRAQGLDQAHAEAQAGNADQAAPVQQEVPPAPTSEASSDQQSTGLVTQSPGGAALIPQASDPNRQALNAVWDVLSTDNQKYISDLQRNEPGVADQLLSKAYGDALDRSEGRDNAEQVFAENLSRLIAAGRQSDARAKQLGIDVTQPPLPQSVDSASPSSEPPAASNLTDVQIPDWLPENDIARRLNGELEASHQDEIGIEQPPANASFENAKTADQLEREAVAAEQASPSLERPKPNEKQRTGLKREVSQLRRREILKQSDLNDLEGLDHYEQRGIIDYAKDLAANENNYRARLRDQYNDVIGSGKSAGARSARAAKKAASGADETSVARYDHIAEQLLEGKNAELTSEAKSLGHGDVNSGILPLIAGGKKQFADVSHDEYIGDILQEHLNAKERASSTARSASENPGAPQERQADAASGEAGGSPRPEEVPKVESAVAPFSLSREASPDTASIVEPFQPASRLPESAHAERQPNLAGMPTDMEKGTLAGQKGLFEKPTEPTGKVHGFGGGATVFPRTASAETPKQLTALVRTHTPGLEAGLRGAKGIKEGILSLLLPSANGPEHLQAAEGLGAELGPMNHRAEVAAHALRPFGKMFDKMGLDREGVDPERNAGTQFRAALSTGREVTGKFRKAADAVTKLFGERIKKLAEVDAPLENVRENYFPGMWTRESREAFNAALREAFDQGIVTEGSSPNAATDAQKAWVRNRINEHLSAGTGSDKDALQFLTRSPIHGKESFRKPKVFDDILTAEQFGLRPISNNPIDLVKLKLAELDKSIMAHGYFKTLEEKGRLQTIDPYKQVPDGWVKINDKYGTKYGPPTVEIPEHIDKAVYEGLLNVAAKLGISHERLATLPRRGALGLSYEGANNIQSKANTETSVIAHEIGHQLDERYDLWNNLLKKQSGKGFKPGRSELRDIADLTERGKIARTKPEKIAQVLEAYIHAPERMQEVAPRVYDWFDNFVKSKPELADLAKIKPGLALTKLTSEKYVGLPIVGYRIVPQAEGDVINNYLSSSLYNNRYFGGLYKAWMGTANVLNQTQLGVGSAFHAGFTTGEAQISSNANVLKDVYGVLRGNRSAADLAASLKKSATATVNTAYTGDKVINAWRNPEGVIDPRIAQVIRAAELGGGGFKLEHGVQTEQLSKMSRDWSSGRKLKAAARSPVAAVEIMAKPIMDYLVPRQKAGVFADLAWRVIEQNPGKSLEELTPEFRQAWNRIDARLGQARYNRLFMNNAAKNVVQGLVRAPGWSGGTIAEIGGAFPDAAKFVSEWAKTGKAPQELPDRVAYTLSLLASTAAVNAALTYAFTGTHPKGLDFFAFRDGNKDENGKETRLLLPTYAKDLLAYFNSPGQTLLNKTHPLISLVNEISQNKDYYGTEIRHPGDPVLKQAGEVAGYVAKSFVPFWLRGAQKVHESGGGLKEQALPFIGVMPAPRHITETSAERIARELIQRRMPSTRTQEEADKAQQRSELRKGVRAGDQQSLDSAVDRGEVSSRSAKGIVRSAGNPPLVNMVRSLTASEALDVWKAASADERAQISAAVSSKIQNAINQQAGGDKAALQKKMVEVGYSTSAPVSTKPAKLKTFRRPTAKR